ncbi:MAG TPA: hypothetical protein VGR20_13885 [Acidimicrobiia bacterium]|jgi:hypothetical protein|nr:hypothetical protein [Acidimicrobiia bacterium]
MVSDGLEGRLAALETTVHSLAAELAVLAAEVHGGAPAGEGEVDLRAEDARVDAEAAVIAAAEAAVVPEPALVGAAGGGDPMRSFLDAFVHAKGQRLTARETADLAAATGVEPRACYGGAHPILRIDGSDRVLTLAGHKLYRRAGQPA